MPAAYLTQERGAKIVAVSDAQGGVYNPDGLACRELVRHADRHGTVGGYPGAEPISNADLLQLECDVLMLCALENQITATNAPSVRARIIAEGANGPLTPEADEFLIKKGVFIIPDVLCNGGGVSVSYFEWVQGLQSFFWTEDEINERLRQIMVRGFHQVSRLAHKKRVDNRTASQILAIERVAAAMTQRGIYP